MPSPSLTPSPPPTTPPRHAHPALIIAPPCQRCLCPSPRPSSSHAHRLVRRHPLCRGPGDPLITSSFALLCPPTARPTAPVCAHLLLQAQYSCRSILPNANDWTRQDDSRRPLRPLTSSPPRRAAIQRRLFTRAHPPLHPIPR